MKRTLLHQKPLTSRTMVWFPLVIVVSSFAAIRTSAATTDVNVASQRIRYPIKVPATELLGEVKSRDLKIKDRWSNSGDPGNQVKVSPFGVHLSPTPNVLHNDIFRFIEEVCSDVVNAEVPGFEYLYLADDDKTWSGDSRRRARILSENGKTTLTFSLGVASFKAGTGVSMEALNGLIEDAINGGALITALQETKDNANGKLKGFADVTVAEYFSLASSSETQESEESPDDTPGSINTMTYQELNDKPSKVGPTIIGSLFGSLLIVAAILLVKRRRSQVNRPELVDDEMVKNPGEISDAPFALDDAATDAETENGDAPTDLCCDADASEVTNYHPRSSTPQGNQQDNDPLDGVSVADSEWTMSTVGERVRSDLWVSASAETFERDRQICIQKDMLQTPWSGEQPVSIPTTKSAKNDFQSWRTQEGESPFVFEQANGAGEGEEVYLMPPSRTRSTRETTEPLDSEVV